MVNNIVGGALIIVIFAQLLFFRLIAVMSIVVYPMAILVPYGVYRISRTAINHELRLRAKIIKITFQLGYIVISALFLNMLFSYPHITSSYIIYFLCIPSSLIGLAGFLKGLMIEVYSPLFRFLNMLTGMFTVFYSFIAIVFADFNFLLHLVTLIVLLGLNGILRAALYLSEYGLSLNKMKSFKIVLYIMDYNLTVMHIDESQF